MASGLAGFASGLSSGMAQGFNMGMQADKNKREAELFALQKEKATLELDEEKRKAKYKQDVAKGLQEVEEYVSGGVIGGEAQDEFGQNLGVVQYTSPSEARASGLKFKEGTTIQSEKRELSENEISKMRAAVFQKARIDNQLMDEDWFEKQRAINKQLEKEGFNEAFEVFERTRDSDKAIAVYNNAKGGKNKAPEGAYMVREIDPETGFPDVVVYAPGQDGKPRRVTSRFEFHLASMPEKLLDYGLQMSKSKYEQTQANKRTGMEVRGRIDAAAIGAKADGGNKKDQTKELIRKIVQDSGDKILGNNQIQLDPVKFQEAQERIISKAYNLIKEGKESDEFGAVVAARNQLGYTNTDSVTGLGKKK